MSQSLKIAIIDYQMSNLFSIKNALDALGIDGIVSSNPKEIMKADGAILPGVGAFEEAMNHLKELELSDTIRNFVQSGKPFMGICLGLQLLFENSHEFGNTIGLGILKGSVKTFSGQEKVKTIPHVGWNSIKRYKSTIEDKVDPLNHIEDGDHFYFVHSLYVQPENEELLKTHTEHEGFRFCSSIMYQNIFASQFHPEKSGKKGLMILRNFFTE